MTAHRPIFVLLMYRGRWEYNVDRDEYKYVIDKCCCVIRVDSNCTFDQSVSSVYRRFNFNPAEKLVMLKYKFKMLDISAPPIEIQSDIDVECFIVECSWIESKSLLCVYFVDKLQPST